MSRQVRYRVAALVLGGLLLGTPLLTNGTANAEQSDPGQSEATARQVVFGGGGVLGLSCRSAPDVGAISVPAESTVRVVNRTGYSAKLRLGGSTRGTVPDQGSTEVVFRRGTTAVLLSPNCALGDQSTPLLVTATPSSTGAPAPMVPGPGDDNAVPATPDDSEPPSSTPDGTAEPAATTPATSPQRTSTTRPGTAPATVARPGHSAMMTPQGMPQGGAVPRVKTKISRGTGNAAPTFAGMPPGDNKTIVSSAPTLELPAISAEAAPPLAPPISDVVAAEPVAATAPMNPSSNGSVGLLGVVAAICVIGVAAGAIRAIVSQRASRANIA